MSDFTKQIWVEMWFNSSSSKDAWQNRNPILWNGENQITGDIMHLIGNNNTRQLDSLKVLNNTFLVSKDTLGTALIRSKG
jgi:hypothetical protein